MRPCTLQALECVCAALKDNVASKNAMLCEAQVCLSGSEVVLRDECKRSNALNRENMVLSVVLSWSMTQLETKQQQQLEAIGQMRLQLGSFGALGLAGVHERGQSCCTTHPLQFLEMVEVSHNRG
jgi:hypothetical protein